MIPQSLRIVAGLLVFQLALAVRPAIAQPVYLPGDVVLGRSNAVQHLRIPGPTAPGFALRPTAYDPPIFQGVSFDHTDGLRANPRGNLLVNYFGFRDALSIVNTAQIGVPSTMDPSIETEPSKLLRLTRS